jgi:hypothetical protein
MEESELADKKTPCRFFAKSTGEEPKGEAKSFTTIITQQ